MYSIPYILLALTLLFLYYNESKRIHMVPPSVAVKLAFVILLVFMGLRGHIYSDFISYYPFYEDLPNIFNLKGRLYDYNFEPGFVIYSSLVKTIMPNYFGWVFINTLLDLIVFRVTFRRYTDSQILPFVFFLAFNGLLIEFNLYRNIKAIDYFLLSLPYLQNRKIVPYMLLNVLGVTLHTSSLIYIPLYFILDKKLPKILIWGGIAAANVIYLAQIHVIGDIINSLEIVQSLDFYDKVIRHNDRNEVSYGLSFGYIERTFSMLLFTFLYDKLVKQRQSNVVFYNCFWLYYVLFLSLYEVSVFVERVPTLFMFSYWILYPNTLSLRIKFKNTIVTISVILALLKVYTSTNMLPAKYDNLILGIEDYDTRRQIQLEHFTTTES